MLTTAADLPYESPLGGLRQAGSPHGLEDWSGQTLWDVRVRAGSADLSQLFSAVPQSIGGVVEIAQGVVAKLRADRYFFVALPDSVQEAHVPPALDTVTITDVTHGYGVIALTAEDARSLLPRVCGLDFSDAVFPSLHAAQTSVAAVAALIVRLDGRASRQYLVLVPRGLAAYLWQVFKDVANRRPQLR